MKKYLKILLGVSTISAATIGISIPLVSCSSNFIYVEGWVDGIKASYDGLSQLWEKMRLIEIPQNNPENITESIEPIYSYSIFLGTFKTWAYKNQNEVIDKLKNNESRFIVQYYDSTGSNHQWRDLYELELF